MFCIVIVKVQYIWLSIQHFIQELIILHFVMYFIRLLLKDRVLTLVKIQGSKNLVNMLTKIVITEKLELCTTSIGQE